MVADCRVLEVVCGECSSMRSYRCNRVESKKLNVLSIKYAVAFSSLVALSLVMTRMFSGTSKPDVKPYIKNQWHNMYLISGAFESFTVPLILFDSEVLPKVNEARREIWHDPPYTCRVLCKHHPSGINLITFSVIARIFIPKKDKIVARLQKLGFAIYLSQVTDPRLQNTSTGDKLPTYLWLAQQDHVIRILILHERHDDYFWAGHITDLDWLAVADTLKPELANWKVLNDVAFTRHAQAFDKSYHLAGVMTKIDALEFVVPFRIAKFLKEHEKSYFVECDHDNAGKFYIRYPLANSNRENELRFQTNARKLLRAAREVLSKLEIPFWLSSGTLLGWYRECDIIPHSGDVDIGIWIRDFNPDIIDQMERNGFLLKNIFGKVLDSFEISFVDENDIKLDIFFFYDEDEYVWNGGTRAHDGAKFKYVFPKFTLCWTEFLEMKVRVPCDSQSVVYANYGPDWMKPVKNWTWYSSPPNVIRNGFWDKSEWNQVIQVYEPVQEKLIKSDEL